MSNSQAAIPFIFCASRAPADSLPRGLHCPEGHPHSLRTTSAPSASRPATASKNGAPSGKMTTTTRFSPRPSPIARRSRGVVHREVRTHHRGYAPEEALDNEAPSPSVTAASARPGYPLVQTTKTTTLWNLLDGEQLRASLKALPWARRQQN